MILNGKTDENAYLSMQFSIKFRVTFILLFKRKTAFVRLFLLTTGLHKFYHTSAQMGIPCIDVSWKN